MTFRVAFALALILVVAVVPLLLTAQANPVPYPMIGMPYEFISANITVTGNGAYARVNGTYPFTNFGYPNVSMSYPLPQDSANVSVEVDENTTFWSYTNQNYSTVFGDLPVINWTIDPAPNTFTVEVDYEHSVPMHGQNFTYFYAMGTWKEVYVKQMTAYVTADITMDSIGENETLEVYVYQILFNSTTQEWVWKRSDCAVSRVNNTFHVTTTVQSDMFRPIEGDFLLTFKKAAFSASLPTDLNEDGAVNIADLTIVAVAFGSKPGDMNWNMITDLDGNSEINILDISRVAKDFGKAVSHNGEVDFFFSFEDDMQEWEARAMDLELGNSTIEWSIVQSQERAKNGSSALKFYLENWNDMGKIWIERCFVVKPNTMYGVNVSYAFASADWGVANFFRIITGVLQEPPKTRDELVYQGDTGNDHPDSDVGYVWLDKSYAFTFQSNANGETYVILGVWGVWETPRTYYLDSIRVVFTQL